MSKPKLAIILGLFLLLGCLASAAAASGGDGDHIAGRNYRFFDQKGKLVTITSRQPFSGDEIITAGGLHYRVASVQGNTARVELVGKEKEYLALVKYYDSLETVPAVANELAERPVAVYHTHSDESYLPTDGVSSIPFEGGIFQVGDTFRNALKDERVHVIYNRTPHDPHDANAYYRSRRTAVQLLKENPAAIFDVHRDGVDDPEFYRRIVSDKNVTQMRLVVGRQNPKMEANLDFAKRLLAFGNKQHPKLLKEIYIARGNYNQDLLPTALLIEAGTYTNEKWQAESGITLLANSIPALLGLDPPAEGITSEQAGRQGWKTALFLIALLALVLIGFIVVNNPGLNVKEYLQKQYEKYVPVVEKFIAKIRFKIR
ncbi:MAG: stage II sporulation protein P [Desulfotomaculaceae bacterium]